MWPLFFARMTRQKSRALPCSEEITFIGRRRSAWSFAEGVPADWHELFGAAIFFQQQ